MKRTSFLCVLSFVTAICQSAPSDAGPIYQFTNYPAIQNGWTLNGAIEVELHPSSPQSLFYGTGIPLQLTQIVSLSLTASHPTLGSFGSWDKSNLRLTGPLYINANEIFLRPGSVGPFVGNNNNTFILDRPALTSTPVGDRVFWSMNHDIFSSNVNHQFYGSPGGGPVAWNYLEFSSPSGGVLFNQYHGLTIATISEVPEPSTIMLVVVFTGCVSFWSLRSQLRSRNSD